MTSPDIIKLRTKAILGFLTNNPDYQLNSSDWQVFLTVAMDEGVTAPELVQKLQMSQQTISRKIRNLGQVVNDDGELIGYDLIRIIPKGKAHSLFLTDNGVVEDNPFVWIVIMIPFITGTVSAVLLSKKEKHVKKLLHLDMDEEIRKLNMRFYE